MAEQTREDREAAARALFGGENWRRWKPMDREYDKSVEHWVDRGAEAGAGFGTLELVTRIRAEGAAVALADPKLVLDAFEALCKAEGARTIEITCDHGKVKVYLDGQPSLRAACKYALRKREEARRG